MARPTVIFDAVGTLILPEPSAAATYCRLAAEAGLPRDVEPVRRRLRQALEAGERDAASTTSSAAGERQFWSRIVRQALSPPADWPSFDELFLRIWEQFSQPTAWRVLAEAAETLASLQAAGWRLAVASNFDSRLRQLCRRLPQLPDELTVFCCDEIGWRKPHPLFYAEVDRRLGDKGPRVMVGDQWQCDVVAPCRAGWQGVLVGTPPAELPRGARAVRRLGELPALLAEVLAAVAGEQ